VDHLGAWPAIAIAVLASTFVGLLNGLIVTRLMVNSFVATLGMATAIEGVGQLYTHQTELVGTNTQLLSIGRHEFLGLPTTVIVAIVVAIALLIVLQFLPIGREFLAVGANRRAAELTGIRPTRRIVLAFAAGGAICGVGGALYGANLGAAGNSTGGTLLLPAFAGAFLGSTAITPGRYNVLGTAVAVLLLAFTISGLEQVGVEAWIQSLIQGVALIVAVAFSSWALRRRAARLREVQLKLLEDDSAVEVAETVGAPPERT
jgi:ribose transport system permease protein